MAPNASLPTLKPNCSASIGTGDRLALELLLGFTGMRKHRVLCGDATILADVEKALGGELADMCFTDNRLGLNALQVGRAEHQAARRCEFRFG